MSGFAAVISVSSLDGTTGFVFNGAHERGQVGASLASLGDVNGDGIDDVLVGEGGRFGAGNGGAYVVFGRSGPAAFGSTLLSSAINGANGLHLSGVEAFANIAISVAGLGDINGDGLGDFVVNAPRMNDNAGAFFVVFGTSSGVAEIDLGALDGTNGFRLNGGAGDYGLSVSSAGDINGDGVNDLLLGGQSAVGSGSYSGVAYVVFGRDTGDTAAFAATLDLAALDGVDGFRLTGQPGDAAGWGLAGGGDLNADGIDDLIVGAPARNGITGGGYIIYGHTGPFAANIALDGTTSVEINGPPTYNNFAGGSVTILGDMNGDGLDDFAIGAGNSTTAYVVFGRTGGAAAFPADIELAALDGLDGFAIQGPQQTGFASVLGHADLNGDGLQDLLIGAQGFSSAAQNSGSVFVLFGRDTTTHRAFSATISYLDLDGDNGFRIDGLLTYDSVGMSVSGAGDINNDGVDDLVIGSGYIDTYGTNSGSAYVIYGRLPPPPVIRVGGAGNETLNGAGGSDQISGGGGNDRINGLGGDDHLEGGDGNDTIYGGAGVDELFGGEGSDVLYGGNSGDDLNGGGGTDKMYGEGGDDVLIGAAGNDRLEGGADNDTLSGGGGADYLDGGLGIDAMAGGADNDVYIVDNALDTVTEAFGEGYDNVRASLSWTLGANLEGLELTGLADIDGTGNELANNLQGNSGANRLDGGAGVDTINGNDGADIIVGGLGNDLLRGGTGADTFVVAHAFGPVLETDQVYDFSAAEGDIIDLRDAFSGTIEKVAAFGKHAGEMTLAFAGGITTLRLDINGDGKVDYQMKINGDVTGEYHDWLL